MKPCLSFVAALAQAAVIKFCGADRDLKAKAIVKHYLLDPEYVLTKDRKAILQLINRVLGVSWSLTAIRDAHPSNLGGIVLPVKAIVQEHPDGDYGYQGNVFLAEALDDPTVTVKDKTSTLIFTSPSEVQIKKDDPELLDPLHGNQARWPDPEPAPETVIDITVEQTTVISAPVTQSNSHNEEITMTTATKTAANRSSSLDVIEAHYKEHKKAIKALAKDFVELIGDEDKRAKTIAKWLKANKERKAEFEAFAETVGEKWEDGDIIVALFIRLGDDPKKDLKSLEKALEAKSPTGGSSSSGVTGEDTSMYFAGGALIGGVTNMLMNGFSVGSATGTVAAAGASYYLGTQIESKEGGKGVDQRPGAVLVGGVLGYFGASAGRIAESFISEQIGEFFGDDTGGTISDGVQIVINTNGTHDPAESVQNNLLALGLI